MYFANDGGIYRALDGYSGLTTGTCGGKNSFESLNQTLGSISQIVSFSQSSDSIDILLAGAANNGSVGTAASSNSLAWQNVNAGYGGNALINPTNDNGWFVSSPPDSISGLNIFECSSGVNCHSADFANNPIVSGSTVGGDAGAFNTAYIFDPQKSAEMLVGTCRVWRGPTAGGTFTALSNNFETGGTGICSGTETNLVRALAAGGPSSNGFSNVIYAGTDGSGPLAGLSPSGGHVWVSTNVSAGTQSWTDQTAAINPLGFPISSIAVDSSDTSGLTAYVAIMGFEASHVWKTVNGGTSWTDFTGSLPNAPANALLIDPGVSPSTGALYVGTDVGVFASSTAAPGWTEVGPAASSSAPGFLPNVAVTALGMFNANGNKRLRASTYGRGIWELVDFNMSRPSPAAIQVNVPGTSSTATFQLSVPSSSSRAVTMSCTGLPAGAVCNFHPGSSVNVPAGSPTTITLTISANAQTPNGNYAMAIHATTLGDPTVTQNLSLTVTGGFSFSITNTSGSQTVIAGQSATYALNVAPSSGSFQNPVTLSCAGLPILAACSFSPQQIVAGAVATPVALTISTNTGTPQGTFTLNVVGQSGQLTQSTSIGLAVQVSTSFSFSLSNTSGSQSINAGQIAHYSLIASPSPGTFPAAVAFSCLGLPTGSSCQFSPAQINVGAGSTPVTLSVTTAGTPSGTYSITIRGTSGSVTANATAVLVIVGGVFNFSLSSSGPSSIATGSSGKYDITATPSAGTFPNPVGFVFSGCPPVSTCSMSSTEVPAGSGISDIFLTVSTVGPAIQSSRLRPIFRWQGFALWLPIWGSSNHGGSSLSAEIFAKN